MIIDWMKMTRQFSLAAASTETRPYGETNDIIGDSVGAGLCARPYGETNDTIGDSVGAGLCARPRILERYFIWFCNSQPSWGQCPSGAHAWVNTHKRGTSAMRG